MSSTWTVELEEDADGNTILPLPEGMLADLDWRECDDLDFQVNNEDGSCTIKNLSWEARQ